MKKYLLFLISSVVILSSCSKKHNPTKPVVDSLKIGLVAYYPFNNSSTDSSGNSNHGTAYNTAPVANRFGKANAAFYFNGSSSYIEVRDNQALRLNNTDFTLNSWVKLDNYDSSFGSAILVKRVSGLNSGWLMSLRGYADTPAGTLSYGAGGGNVNAFGTQVVALNSWAMVTCVYSLANQQLSIYINGVLDNVTNNILTPNALITASLYIGSDNPTLATPGYFFHGALDDIRIYNRALSLNQIKKLYNLTY